MRGLPARPRPCDATTAGLLAYTFTLVTMEAKTVPSEWARRWAMRWRSGGACADAGSWTAVVLVHCGSWGAGLCFLGWWLRGCGGYAPFLMQNLKNPTDGFLMGRFLNARS